jgi:4,5-dihydroxyphthalate decarboxylase
MPSLPITFACGLYDRMLALQTGDIKPDGIDLNFLAIDNPREIFDRMSNRLEFDACEMSSSEFVSRYAAKKLPFVALPVFASRVFRHGFIVVNRKFITSAKDLAGKRIGVPLYTQTAAIFVRGLMQHDLGVDLSTIEWVQGAVNEPGAYGNPSVMPLLKPIKITPNQSGKSLSDLLAAGEIHAIIGSNMPRALKRHPDVARLFSGLPGAREGLLPPHQDIPDHASGRDPQRHLRAASLRRHQPVQRLRRRQGLGARENALPRHAPLHAAMAARRHRGNRRVVRR